MDIEIVRKYVYTVLHNEPSGHDYLHALRVYQNCTKLLQDNLDSTVIYVSALVHDLIDYKLEERFKQSKEQITAVLEQAQLSVSQIKHVFDIIENLSYSQKKVPHTLEGKIVQDADRLDALGAIGVARAFSFGGNKGRPLYDLSTTNGTDTISHFYQKLLRLEDTFHTPKAQAIAQERTQVMKQFLDEFYKEVTHNEYE